MPLTGENKLIHMKQINCLSGAYMNFAQQIAPLKQGKPLEKIE